MANDFIEEVRAVLDERSQEVRRHLRFSEILIESKANCLAKKTDHLVETVDDYSIDRSLVKTITATAYLMIYNMVESTMTEAIDAVHQQLRQDNMTFSQLSEKLKEVCFKNFKSSIESTRERQNKGETFDSALVWLGYKKDNHWNGNIDARSIRTTAAKYGFNIAPTDYTATRHGESLLKVKTTRNKLAHGEVSFEECGQGTAIEELMEIHEQAVMYLSAVIDGIETYLDNKAYVAA